MKFTLVFVLYEKKINEVPFFSLIPDILKEDVTIICYDHSKDLQKTNFSDHNFIYLHDPRNLGLNEAYNFALKKAEENGSQGLLLLDDDSFFSMEFILDLKKQKFTEEVAVIVPKISTKERQISPLFATEYINRFSKPVTHPGFYEERIMGINSGSFWSIKFLREINGFSQDFPLDFLDHWLFFEVFSHHKKVQVINTTLKHDLSVEDYTTLPHERYEKILKAETLFYKKYDQKKLKAHKRQLFKRIIKQRIKVYDNFYQQATRKELLKLMFGKGG